MIAIYLLFALFLFGLISRVMPNKVALSAWIAGVICASLIWVSFLGEALVYVWRRRGRFRAFLAHRDRCVGCGARLLHSMLHDGLSYQCGSCDLIQPWEAAWDRRGSIERFTDVHTDEVFRKLTGKTREEYFSKMDQRGAAKGHAAALEAIRVRLHPYTAEAIAICYEVDRRCDQWFDRETPMFEPTLLGMLVRTGFLIAVPAGLVAWRLLLST